MTKIYVNLFFLTKQNKGGVYRFAYEVLIVLDNLIGQLNLITRYPDTNYQFIGVMPNIQDIKVPDLQNIQIIRVSKIKSHHIWEQIILPRIVKGNFLINLCNYAPLFKYNQLCVIHDALVYTYPESYSKVFVLFSRMFYKLIIKHTRYIATVSNFSKQEIIKYITKPKNEITVLGNSGENFLRYKVDNTILKQYNLKPQLYILAVFSQKNSAYKNITRYLQAISQIDYKFVCVGNIDAKYTQDKIINIGYVSDAELKALYINAYSFIIPSVYEGFGIPILEAMHCGTPVLAADIPVFREICADAVIYFDPYNNLAITAAIAHIITHPEQRADLISAGYKQVAKYSWHNIAQTLLNIIA